MTAPHIPFVDAVRVEFVQRIANDHLFSDAMDSAVTAFHSLQYGIHKNIEKTGEQVDGEKIMRRSLQYAFCRFLEETDLLLAAYEAAQKARAFPANEPKDSLRKAAQAVCTKFDGWQADGRGWQEFYHAVGALQFALALPPEEKGNDD